MAQKIESPISIFNNIITNITNEFEKILFSDLKSYKFDVKNPLLGQNNKIIFNDKSIILMNFIKLSDFNGELVVKILKPHITKKELSLINNLYTNWDLVYKSFYHYLLMYNNIALGYDDAPNQLIDSITTLILNTTINGEEFFILPNKLKISAKYDTNKTYLNNIFNRYDFIIKFSIISKTKFNYKIIRVLASEFDQNKNDLRNIRFMETDVIVSDVCDISKTNKFISKLFHYGELLKNK